MMHLLKISTMIKGFKFFNICLLFFLNTSVFSQNQTFKSTIKSSYSAKNITEKEVVEITKDFVSKKEYKQALNCITKHYKTYSKSLEINWLYENYGDRVNEIGFSGHHLGIALDVAAYTLGARWIERHFTKDRTWKGTDHAASLEPGGLAKLTRDLKSVYEALNYKTNEILPIESVQREKLKNRK